MHLWFLLAVVSCSCSRQVFAGDCLSPECIFRGLSSNFSGVEFYLVETHIEQIPENVSAMCDLLHMRIDDCSHEAPVECSELTYPWDQRMSDPYYVTYLMRYGDEFCVPSVLELQACFTQDLQTRIHTDCYLTPYDANTTCIHEEYSKTENCTAEIDQLFYSIVDEFIAVNPYKIDTENEK